MDQNQKSNGAMVGLIVIVLILIIGGIYMWNQNMKQKALDVTNDTPDASQATSATQLDANIDNIDLDSLDSGL